MKSILGIGNALTDIIVRLPNDSLLQKFHLPLGSMFTRTSSGASGGSAPVIDFAALEAL